MVLAAVCALGLLAALVTPAGARQPQPFDGWASLRNPVVDRPDRMQKDQAVVLNKGRLNVFASTRLEDLDQEAPGFADRVSFLQTRDLKRFKTFKAPELGVAASPDVVRNPAGGWVMVYQSPGAGGVLRLHVATTADLVHWTQGVELMPDVFPGERVIDGALAYESGHWYVGLKRAQAFYVTRSLGPALDGRWETPVAADAACGFTENYQFLKIDGHWRMIATGRDVREYGPEDLDYNEYTSNHAPFIYSMAGRGDSLADWTRWVGKRRLEIPTEQWNTVAQANSASLLDAEPLDGWYYLFYAGSNDSESFQRRGHAKIGVARSRNLVDWVLPGDTRDGDRSPEPHPVVDPAGLAASGPIQPCHTAATVGFL